MVGMGRMAAWALVSFLAVTALAGCPRPTETTSTPQGSDSEPGHFTVDNWETLATDPEAHRGASVDVAGQVFGQVERDEDGTYWQMFVDPETSSFNVLVRSPDSELDVHSGDYVRVVGTVRGKFEGENLMGGTIVAPVIDAGSTEQTSVLATLHTPELIVPVGETDVQHDVGVTLEKIEVGPRETRVFVTVKNASNAKFYVSDIDAKLIQGDTQFDAEMRLEYPELQYELLPGVTSSGVVAFGKVRPTGSVRLAIEGRSENYRLDFRPYQFEVALQDNVTKADQASEG